MVLRARGENIQRFGIYNEKVRILLLLLFQRVRLWSVCVSASASLSMQNVLRRANILCRFREFVNWPTSE